MSCEIPYVYQNHTVKYETKEKRLTFVDFTELFGTKSSNVYYRVDLHVPKYRTHRNKGVWCYYSNHNPLDNSNEETAIRLFGTYNITSISWSTDPEGEITCELYLEPPTIGNKIRKRIKPN